MGYQLNTTSGLQLSECISALQKEIRRGNKYEATYWALEIYNSNYRKYLWERLLIISAEDVHDPMNHLIVKSLYDSWTNIGAKDKKHRIFLTRAVLQLCEAPKNRNADHFQNLVDKNLEKGETLSIPDYAKDVHTKAGRTAGMTKKDFFEDEYEALQPIVEDEQDKKAAEQLLLLL